jgi:hypothetical protein
MGIPFEKQRRFRINPIEIAIFSVISLIFVKSSYSLLYSHEGDTSVLTSSVEDPLSAGTGRTPASATVAQKTFSEVKIGCDEKESPAVTANKIRFIGSLCNTSAQTAAATSAAAATDTPSAPTAANENVKKISVINTSAKVAATVFPDYTNQRFSTDYITLAEGKNLIYVQYEYKDGTTLAHEFSIVKN